MILVERERELAALENVFAACRGGSGTILLISGAVGSGKTALMHAFAARALAGNAIFLSAAATHSGRALPLGVLGQLFRGARLPAANSARAAHLLDDGTLKAARYGSTATSGAAALPSARIFSGLSKVILD